MPLILVRNPDSELLGRLSRIKSFTSLTKAIQEWVPNDFTCVAGTDTESMSFPPRCLEDLKPADIETVSKALQIRSSSAHAFWAFHYFSINTLPHIPAKAVRYRKAASDLIERIGSIKLQNPANSSLIDPSNRGLPTAPAILFATIGHAGYRESRWRYGLKEDAVADDENWQSILDRLCMQEELFGFVMVAGEVPPEINHARDVLLTLYGRLSTWDRREEFLVLLDELGDLLTFPSNHGLSFPLRAENKEEIVYLAWAGLRDLATEAKTYFAARDVATELLAILGVQILPNSAEKFLRRHAGGHPP